MMKENAYILSFSTIGASFTMIGLLFREENVLSSNSAWISTGFMRKFRSAAPNEKILAIRIVTSITAICLSQASAFAIHSLISPTTPLEIQNYGAGEDFMHAAFVAEKNSLKESSPQQ